MAAGSKLPKCNCCNKSVTKNSKSLRCGGFCHLWYHCACVDITNEEYESFALLKCKAVWFCDKCSVLYKNGLQQEEVMVDVSNDSPNSNGEEGNDSNQMISHIRILTDQIFELTETQKGLSEQVMILKTENENMKYELQSHAEYISGLLNNKEPSFVNIVNSGVNKKVINNSQSKNLNQDRPRRLRKDADLTDVVNVDIIKTIPKSTSLFTLPQADDNPKKTKITGTSVELKHDCRRPFHSHNINMRLPGTSTTAMSTCSESELPVVNYKVSMDNDNGFQEVKSRKHVRNERKSTKRKTEFITGNSTLEHNLSTCDKRIFLFTSRFSPLTECNDLIKFLEEHKINDCVVEKLNSKFPDSYSSFKIGVPSGLFSDVYKPDFWPRNVFVTKFKGTQVRSRPTLNQVDLNLERASTAKGS